MPARFYYNGTYTRVDGGVCVYCPPNYNWLARRYRIDDVPPTSRFQRGNIVCDYHLQCHRQLWKQYRRFHKFQQSIWQTAYDNLLHVVHPVQLIEEISRWYLV